MISVVSKAILGYLRLVVLLSCFLAPFRVMAQHPVEVQRKVAAGEYYAALKTYNRIPQRRATRDSRMAAAKAAWALSLPERAIDEFDRLLRDQEIAQEQRARLLLSRGIIEYQERRFRAAILYAERAVEALPESSPLRGNALALWGEALFELQSYGAAEQRYEEALKDAPPQRRSEIHYRMGMAQYRLGKREEARRNFEMVQMEHELTPNALRQLIVIALEERNFEQADFWLNIGRRDYPNAFFDSWVDYARLQVAIQQSDLDAVRKIQEEAQQKFAPSDQWLNLINAAAEISLWGQYENNLESQE